MEPSFLKNPFKRMNYVNLINPVAELICSVWDDLDNNHDKEAVLSFEYLLKSNELLKFYNSEWYFNSDIAAGIQELLKVIIIRSPQSKLENSIHNLLKNDIVLITAKKSKSRSMSVELLLELAYRIKKEESYFSNDRRLSIFSTLELSGFLKAAFSGNNAPAYAAEFYTIIFKDIDLSISIPLLSSSPAFQSYKNDESFKPNLISLGSEKLIGAFI